MPLIYHEIGADGGRKRRITRSADWAAARSSPPWASTDFVIEESDRTGGSAPSFIVEWMADRPVSEAIIQSLMIGTMSQQGISFVGDSRVLESR